MAKAEKTQAEKKVTITDLNAAIAELDGAERIKAAIQEGLVKAELDEVEIESGKYSGDYVKLTLGPAATDEQSVVRAMLAIANGNLTSPNKEGSDEVDQRAPSVVKWFLYGADLAARSRTSQRIKSAAEGPDKAIEQMAKLLVKNKPGTSMDDAREMARTLLAD